MKENLFCKMFDHKWERKPALDEYTDSPMGYYKRKLYSVYVCKRCGKISKVKEKG